MHRQYCESLEEQHLISDVSGADGGRSQGRTEKNLGGEKPEGCAVIKANRQDRASQRKKLHPRIIFDHFGPQGRD